MIYITGKGIKRDFSTIIIDSIPNIHLMDTGQALLEYNNELGEFIEGKSNISNEFIERLNVNHEDVLAYVYAILHSNEYRAKYQNDLRKDMPRIPLLNNKQEFIDIGKELIDLHLNYEKTEPYPLLDIEILNTNPSYLVKKMRFPKRNEKETIIFNGDIRINNIPEKAYEYIVNGRSAIEWIMDQYQVKTDRKSGITDDPNLYSKDEKYIFT